MNYSKEAYLDFLENKSNVPAEEVAAVRNDLMFKDELQLVLETVSSDPELFSDFHAFFYLVFPNLQKIMVEESRFLMLTFNGSQTFLKESTFLEIRNVVKKVFGLEESNESEFNPANEAAAKIAKKLEDRHRRLAAERGDNDKEASMLLTSASMISTANSISIREVFNYTLLQLYIQVERIDNLKTYESQITLGAFAGLKDVELADWRKQI